MAASDVHVLSTYTPNFNGQRHYHVLVVQRADLKLSKVQLWPQEPASLPTPIITWPEVQKVWVGATDGHSVHDYLEPILGYTGEAEDFASAHLGNTLLLALPNKTMVYIDGLNINTFQLPADEEIISYHSPMGANDVPYAWFISTHYHGTFADDGHVLLLPTVYLHTAQQASPALDVVFCSFDLAAHPFVHIPVTRLDDDSKVRDVRPQE